MKKGGKLFRGDKLLLLGIIVFSILIGWFIALDNTDVTVTDGGPGSYYIVKEDQLSVFNFTVNNSFAATNITIINVTIDSTFAYQTYSNGTSATLNLGTGAGLFSNTTTMLGWANTSTLGSLVYPDTNTSFWFNATPSTPGNYTLTILTYNSTGLANTTHLTVTVLEIHNVMRTTGTRNFSVIDEDTSSLFNITLNTSAPTEIINITVSFPSTFIYTMGSSSNGSGLYYNATHPNVPVTFTNTTTSITWANSSGFSLVTNITNSSVWFNLTALNPGTYNFTVTTVNRQDHGAHVQNFTVSVRDITNHATSKITNGANYYVVKEDQSFAFNFTINNSLNGGNITQVNITIPSTFAFVEKNSNGTSAILNLGGGGGIFANLSTMLGWANASTSGSLVYPDTNTTFWFNATPSTPGNYSITLAAANKFGNAITMNGSSIDVIVMEIHNVMTTTGIYNFSVINEDVSSRFNITLNNTIHESYGNITNITITFPSTFIFTTGTNDARFYTNETRTLGVNSTFTNTTTSITWKNSSNGLVTSAVNGSVWFNLTAQEPGTYNFSVTTVNNQDNGVHVQNFTVSVRDTTDPETPVYNCSKTTGISEGEQSPTCLCTATDNYDSSPTLSYTSSLPTTNAGTYTVSCTATDDATYNSTAYVTYTVDASGGNVVSGTSGGGTTYTNTYVEDKKEFSQIKEISKDLGAKNRIRIMINNIKHEIGVKALTATTATIEVTSTPQTAILSIGDTKKFDVTNDGYYDLSVTLNKIANSKASITLKSIYEKVTTETVVQEQEEQAAAEEAEQIPEQEEIPEIKSNTIIWVIVIIIVILIIVGIGYWIKKKR